MEKILFFIGLISIISSLAIRVSKRSRIPILLIYLGLGMLLGSSGLGVNFEDYISAQNLGIFALCYILFAGALETKLSNIKNVLWEGVVLSTVGVILTSVVIGGFIYLFFHTDILSAFLIGAIISSTDAAAVIAIFNFSEYRLPHKLENVVKLESGSNDPVAYTLIIFIISLIHAQTQTSFFASFMYLIVEITIGFIAGIVFGKIGEWILSKLSIGIFEFNQILILGLVILTYGGTQIIHGNGFLAVYILGLYLGKSQISYKNTTIRVYNTISWIMQIAMFILLGLLVFPSELLHIWKESLFISIVLIFIARPLTVFICLHFFKYNIREKTFISWAGLKGAVPIVFGTYPVVAGLSNGHSIFHIVFFVVILSVLLQGTTLDLLASLLKLSSTPSGFMSIQTNIGLDKIEYIEDSLVQIVILPSSRFIGEKIKNLDLPNNVIIMSIKRGKLFFTPKGDTELLLGDQLFIMTSDRTKFVQGYLARKYAERKEQEIKKNLDSSS
jgi:cell volume regulation protein A